MKVKLPMPELTATIYCEADLRDFKGVSGVYCIYGHNGDLLYVGKAKCFKDRITAHLSGGSNVGHVSQLFSSVKLYEIDHGADREIYETYMINKLKPLYNESKVYYSRKKPRKHTVTKKPDNHTSNAEWLAQLAMIPPEDVAEFNRLYRVCE